jgi:hypothetical protein
MAKPMMGASAHLIVTGAALSRARGRLAFWRTRLRLTAISHSMERRIRTADAHGKADDWRVRASHRHLMV